jgi:drug/metabolite transporter (DMT)-like permease
MAGRLWPLGALFAGALAIAASGIFVRLSETGPTATAFWRAALALPALAAWALIERRAAPQIPHGFSWPLLWCGVFFAGDLLVWHWSLLLTSVAASTLEANLAPLFVTAFAWIIWRQRPRPAFLAALALALAGVVLIVAPKLGGGSVAGDALGIATAVFYAGYLLVVVRVREERGAGNVMFWSTLVVAVVLLPIALTQVFLPATPRGWALLAGLALVCQVAGQGLIAWSFAHLPATFGAVGLYVQPVAAAVYAWWLLGERLEPVQVLGGAVVLGAIALARRASR